MTKTEYLTSLAHYLVTMSESEKIAIIKEYDNHFRAGYEAGKSESQIAASLGSPYDVATELLAGRKPPVPTYPPRPRPQTSSDAGYIGQSHTRTAQPRPQTAAQPRPQTAAQPRPQTATQPRPQQQVFTEPVYPQQPVFTEPAYPQPQPIFNTPTYPQPQQIFDEPAYTQPRPQTYADPAYSQPRPQAYADPAYSQPRPQTYADPAYTQPRPQASADPAYAQPRPQTYAEPAYPAARPQSAAYVDYDRAAAEEEPAPKKKRESKYSTTGIVIVSIIGVVLAVILVPTVYYLVRGIYELLRAFPGTGVALIVAGGSLSANNLWICLGLIFIGISFLALTGLLVMAIIEIVKLSVKLFKYVKKECKKMIKEGSF